MSILKRFFSTEKEERETLSKKEAITRHLESTVPEDNWPQAKRAVGAVLGSAIGDALGAGYEFTKPSPTTEIRMKGGGPFNFAPGEGTDDTDQAYLLLEAINQHGLTSEALDSLAAGLYRWYEGNPKDIGSQTKEILEACSGETTAEQMVDAARAYHEQNLQSGGNGSLMRIAPLAAAYGASETELVEFARRTSQLTHFDPDAGDSCALWALALRFTVLTGGCPDFMGLIDKVHRLPADRQYWRKLWDASHQADPNKFTPNGYVLTALQACWATMGTIDFNATPDRQFREGLETVIRVGNDTDTTAAILGGWLGAYCGYEAIPDEWLDMFFLGDHGGVEELAAKILLAVNDRSIGQSPR